MRGAWAAGVGEDQAGAAVQGGEGGAQGAAAGGGVVHEVDLAGGEVRAGGAQVVFFGRGGGQVAAVAGALGFNGLGAAEGVGELRPGAEAGDMGGQDGVGAGAAVAGRDRDKPARGLDEGGHFGGGGREVAGGAAGIFEGVGEAAGFGFGRGERAVAGRFVFAGGEDVHGAMPAPLRQRRRGRGRLGLVFVGQHHGDGGGGVVHVHRARGGDEFDQARRLGVGVADIEGDRQAAGAGLAADDGEAEHPDHVPKPAGFVLAGDAGRDGDALLIDAAGDEDGEADARFPRGLGYFDLEAVRNRLRAGVLVDDRAEGRGGVVVCVVHKSGGGEGSDGEVAELAERGVAGVADNDVVEDFDFEKLAGADEVAGDSDVGLGGGGFAGGVVVHEHQRGGGGHDGEAEHWQRVDQERVVGADAEEVVGFDAAAGVEEQHREAFTFGVEGFGLGDVQAPVGGGGFRGIAKGHVVGGAGFAEGNDFVNVGGGSEAEGFDDFVQPGERGLEGSFWLLIRTGLEP